MTVHALHWRTPGCSIDCIARSHDPAAHEAWGRMTSGPVVVRTGPLVVNLSAGTVVVDGDAVRLSRLEWRILEYLARQVGCLVTNDALISAVWGPACVNPTLMTRGPRHRGRVDLHMLRVRLAGLRRRLGPAGRLVTTVHDIGRRLEQERPLS